MPRPLGAVDTPPELADQLVAPIAASPSILDPACGTGDLLLAALRARGGGPGALAGLCGIELDPERARRARERLGRAAGVDPRSRVGRALDASIRTADALDPGTAWDPAAAIAANPPWGSLSGRERLPEHDLPKAPAADWRGPGGWPSLHGAFVVRIAAHVRSSGAPARILIPASLLELEGYAEVRAAATARCRLDAAPLLLGEDRFPGVLEPAALVELGPTRTPRATRGPWVALDPHDESLCAALADHPRLPETCFGDPGVHTGNSARELLVPVERAEARTSRPIREGRDLLPYRLMPPRLAVRTDLERSSVRRFRIGAPERLLGTAVLVRQTANRPLAAVHTPPALFRNSLLAVRPPADLDPAAVVAILNGPVAAAWHRARFPDARQRAFPQVKVRHLRSLPFPFARRAEAPRLHDELARRARRARREDVLALEQLTLRAYSLGKREEARARNLASS